MAYVYAHRKKSDNSIFYIGIGSDSTYKRAKSANGRNALWNKIVSKYGFSYEILVDNISFDEAKKDEADYILKFGRIDLKSGILCNFTDGGEGKVNYITSNKTKELMRNAKLGRVLCNKTKSAISQSKRKIVVNLLNGVFYESAMEAAYYNNINLNTLYSNLSSKRSNKTNLIYT